MFNLMTPKWLLGGPVIVVAALLLMTFAPAARGADDAVAGADPYVPSQAEWLCLTLNVEQAVNAISRSPGDVTIHYAWDESRPNTIGIVVSYPSKLIGPRAVAVRTQQAKRRLMEAAERRGWASWLEMDVHVVEE